MVDENFFKSPKVLIFTAPVLCRGCVEKAPKIVEEGNEPFDRRWRKSVVTVDENLLTSWSKQSACSSENDLTEGSDMRLEYDPLTIQESVYCYLESEFRGTDSSSVPITQSSLGFETRLSNTQPNAAGNIEGGEPLQKEFEDLRCASQRLLAEHDSFSSRIEDGRGLKRKRDKSPSCESKTDAHPLTMEDVYTQDKYLSSSGNSKSPATTTQRKQIKLFSDPNLSPKPSNPDKKFGGFIMNTVPKVCDEITLLKDCTTENAIVNIVFIVIQVNHTRDVEIKSGANAGSFIAVSSILVADESKSCFKVTLWREASRWVDKVISGDFAVATGVKVGKWRDEYVGQTTFKSSFYNLHQPKSVLSFACLKLVSQERFNHLSGWARSEHPYLFTVSRVKKTVEFTEIAQLRDNTLVNFRGRVISVRRNSTATTYRFGDQQLAKITVDLAERPGDMIKLSLWGRQSQWMNQLQEGLGSVWEFQYLTVKYSADTGCVSLHTTPRSTKTKLITDEERKAKLIGAQSYESANDRRKFSSVRDLLQSKYTGLAEIKADIASLQFHCEQDEIIVIDQTIRSNNQLKGKIGKLVYIGCGSCARALDQDHNGVYGQCVHCVTANPDYQYTVEYYYKPVRLLVKDACAALKIEAFSRVVSRLFKDYPAKSSMQKHVDASSRDSFAESFIAFLNSLVNGVKLKMLIACHVDVDENSFVKNRSFTLLEIEV